VPNHIFTDGHSVVDHAVVYQKLQPNKVRQDGRRSCLCLYRWFSLVTWRCSRNGDAVRRMLAWSMNKIVMRLRRCRRESCIRDNMWPFPNRALQQCACREHGWRTCSVNPFSQVQELEVGDIMLYADVHRICASRDCSARAVA